MFFIFSKDLIALEQAFCFEPPQTLQRQNELIINILTKQNEILEQASATPPVPPVVANVSDVVYGKNLREMLGRFPLSNLEALAKYEADLNEENMQKNANIVSNLLAPHGLVKNISNVISDTIIMAVNVDGHHGKRRLLDFGKFIDVLYSACYKDDYPKKTFLNDLRRALRNTKNRCHKNNCIARQKLRECATEAVIPSLDIVKTEKFEFEKSIMDYT
ncbi:uncharacterized protein isoform X2 [Musca autumnalis]|uniref:uncharacterized protein isoform X2 n=1 Tax=Musca autumnalis TaxID=221902 RepID=UPI003CE78B23